MRTQISAAELQLWREYWKLDPKNEHRADLRNALLMQLVHEFARQGKGVKRRVEDFVVYDPQRVKRNRSEPHERTAQEIKHGLMAAFGRR